MARIDASDAMERLAPREAARMRARDRKRVTRMVVDNAGVRRILLQRASRRRTEPAAPGHDRP